MQVSCPFFWRSFYWNFPFSLSVQLDPGIAVSFHTITEESKSKKDRPRPVPPKPGQESRRKTVEAQKPIDIKYHGQVWMLFECAVYALSWILYRTE